MEVELNYDEPQSTQKSNESLLIQKQIPISPPTNLNALADSNEEPRDRTSTDQKLGQDRTLKVEPLSPG